MRTAFRMPQCNALHGGFPWRHCHEQSPPTVQRHSGRTPRRAFPISSLPGPVPDILDGSQSKRALSIAAGPSSRAGHEALRRGPAARLGRAAPGAASPAPPLVRPHALLRAASGGGVPGPGSEREERRKGPITKAGNERVRWLLFQVALSLLWGKSPQTAHLREWAERIAVRRGKKTAVVALARRLAGILFAMMRDGTEYQPPKSAELEAAV